MMGVRTRQTSARWLMSFVLFLQGAPAAPPPPTNAKAAAPIDFIGQWVSVVTEDWRYRMITPPKGNYAGVPLMMRPERSPTTGIPPKTKPQARSVRHMGLQILCGFQDAFE